MGKRLKKINWKNYNKELIKRGSITFWFTENVKNHWLADKKGGGRGFQPTYSHTAIETIPKPQRIRLFKTCWIEKSWTLAGCEEKNSREVK